MKKGLLMIVVLVLVVGVFLYSGGYFGGSHSTASSISVVTGWNDITIPDSWPDTTAQGLASENPSLTTISYWSTAGGSGHWVSWLSVIPNVNNFDITPGMELKVLATGNGIITAPR